MEQRRLILAVALSIAFLFGYQYLFGPEPGRRPAGDNAARPAQDNRAQVPGAPAAPAAAPVPAVAAPATQAPVRSVRISTPLYTADLTTEGGAVRAMYLDRYKDVPGAAGKPLNIVATAKGLPLPLSLSLEGSQPALPANPVFATDAPAEVRVGPGETQVVRMAWESAGGIRIEREYRFSGDRYDFDVSARVTNGSAEPMKVTPGLNLAQEYVGEMGADSYTFTGIVANRKPGKKEEVVRYDFKAIDKGKVDAGSPVLWAAADSKYFALTLVPGRPLTLAAAARVGEKGVRLTLADNLAVLMPGEAAGVSARAFFGPKQYNLLAGTANNLEELVDYGWFSFFAKPLIGVLKASNRVTGNYGLDIIILTVLIKILFFPLTQKSMASMRKMQDLAPVLAKLKEKYKDDPARLNQETMNLYKTYKINPLGGCLPMLAQIPIFIALYKGLLVSIELRHAPFILWIQDLSAPEHLWDLHLGGITIPIRLLALLMGVSMFVQQKMTPTAAGTDPMQQKMMLLLPVVFTFMFWGFPTGLVIYWLVNNLLSIAQQLYHNHQVETAKRASAA